MKIIELSYLRAKIEDYFTNHPERVVHQTKGNTYLAPDNTSYTVFVNGAIKREGEDINSFCNTEEHFFNGITAWIDTKKGKVLYWRDYPSLYLEDKKTSKIRARLCIGEKVIEVE